MAETEKKQRQPISRLVTDYLKTYFDGISIDCLAVCVYFLCMPFTIVTVFFGWSLLKVVSYGVTATLVWKLFIGDVKPMRFNILHFVYALYVIYSVSEYTFFRSQAAWEVTLDMIVSGIVLVLITMRIYNKNERELIETVWVIIGIICAYLCLSSNDTLNEFEDRTLINIFGFSEDPNMFCAYFIMPTLICVKRIIEKRRLMPLYALLLIIIYYAILKTGSRGGLIGVSVGLIFCVMIAVRGIKSKVLFIVLGVLVVFVVMEIIMPLLPESVSSRYSIKEVIESKGTSRFILWDYTIQYLAERPDRLIRGCGIFSSYEVFALSSEIHNGVCHNQFIQVLLDQGIIGEALYLAVIFTAVIRNIKRHPYYSCAFISICAFAMSLTMYIFKPYINVIMMCAMNYEDDTPLPGGKGDDKSNGKKNIL